MKKAGFTLVEILVSLFILGLGIVVTFNLLPLAWQSLSYSRKLNEVSYLAQEKFEELRSKGESVSPGDTSGQDGELDWAISIKPLQLGDDIEVLFIELNIDFSFQGIAQRQRFVTYLFKS